jgi:cytochrome c oxidase subunit III
MYYLGLTICYGVLFTLLQAYEYLSVPFSISSSVFGSIFFMVTGFHGFHVIIGTIFLVVC